MICCECKKEIDPTKPHFWGNLGGEWHPACYAQVNARGGYATGLWHGMPDTATINDNPEEYLAERERLAAAMMGKDRGQEP